MSGEDRKWGKKGERELRDEEGRWKKGEEEKKLGRGRGQRKVHRDLSQVNWTKT